MRRTILEPLRWLGGFARVMVIHEDGAPQTLFQITNNIQIQEMCVGRPVEELPRILSILSPAHHLVSALTLDSVFNVNPTPLAVNIRNALSETLFFIHHMRKLYFLFTSESNPLDDFTLSQRNTNQPSHERALMDEIMRHVVLAQEASRILGGRSDHPVSIVPGGVSRFLKEPYYDRLDQIAGKLASFAVKIGSWVSRNGFGRQLQNLEMMPINSLSMSPHNGEIELRESQGKIIDTFRPELIFEKIGVTHEPWTYQAFSFITATGWSAPDMNNGAGAYFVGPMARLRANNQTDTRIDANPSGLSPGVPIDGEAPTISNAYGAMVAELIGSASRIKRLFRRDSLTGPSIRTIPGEIKQSGFAAMESPEGLIAHQYKVDSRGIVEEIQVLDAATQNNALKCMIAQKVVKESTDFDRDPKAVKLRIEKALLPF